MNGMKLVSIVRSMLYAMRLLNTKSALTLKRLRARFGLSESLVEVFFSNL